MGTKTVTFWQALNEALREEMQRDDKVVVIGEDVGLYGGAYGVSRGLFEEFGPDRVLDTPISEAAIAGCCAGAAMTGLRPVGEIMYIDFATIAMDELVNIAAKNRYMFGGKTKVPMVMRTEGGTGRGIAGHHSGSWEAWFLHAPGLYVVMPATPHDAKGLLKSAIRDDNPIMFIEHKAMYGLKGEIPEEEYLIPLGKGDIKREGSDVTIVAYSLMVHYALEAAKQLAAEGIEAEVIDPRSLKPLDEDMIYSSVKKTSRAVVVSEAVKTCGFGGELAALIMENCFDYLDAAVVRVTGEDVVIPMSPVLEEAAVPSVEKIVAAVHGLLG